MTETPKTIIIRDTAREQRLTRFFTGVACRHEHVAERYTGDGKCVACESERTARRVASGAEKERGRRRRIADPEKAREQVRLWQQTNPEKVREMRRRYRTENADKVREQARLRYAADPEKARERDRLRYAADPEKARERDRLWRQANPEKVREYARNWQKANPEKVKATTAKWRERNPDRWATWAAWQNAKQRGAVLPAEFSTPAALVTSTISFYSEARRLSEQTGVQHHVDHRVPLALGGEHHPANLRVVPAWFNQVKSSHLDGTLLELLKTGSIVVPDLPTAFEIAQAGCGLQ